ncbi:hypothetical protein ACFL08_05265 [Patescibacteria group bacterium]
MKTLEEMKDLSKRLCRRIKYRANHPLDENQECREEDFVVGFSIVEGDERIGSEELERIENINNGAKKFVEDCDELKTVLGNGDVKHVAIFPEKVWNKICRSKGLFRFASLNKNSARN